MRVPILTAALMLGCNGDKDQTGPTGDTGTPADFFGVMRDCPPDQGTICPYAGAGYNGKNTEDSDRLDIWFSFPMSIAFPQNGGNPVLADWNNHRLMEVQPTVEEGLVTIMGTQFLGDGDPE